MSVDRRTKRIATVAGLLLLSVGVAFGAEAALRSRGGSCPFARHVTDAESAAHRGRALFAVRGEAEAPAHRARGLELGASTRADAIAWAAENGLACEATPADKPLRCGGGALHDAVLSFDGEGHLDALDVRRAPAAPASAVDDYHRAGEAIAALYGAPTSGERRADAVDLAAAPLRQAALAYRFTDLAVDLSATHFPSGVVVREQYRRIAAKSASGG